MVLLKEHIEEIEKLNEKDFNIFLEDLRNALFLEVTEAQDLLYYMEGYDFADGEELDEDEMYEIYDNQVSERVQKIREFGITKDINYLKKVMRGIKSSYFFFPTLEKNDYRYDEQLELLNSTFSLDLTKDIVVYNNTGKRYSDL